MFTLLQMMPMMLEVMLTPPEIIPAMPECRLESFRGYLACL